MKARLSIAICLLVAPAALLGGTTAGAGSRAVPQNLSPPTISGIAEYGAQLTAASGTWSSEPNAYVYQWQRCVRYSELVGQDAPISNWRLGEPDGAIVADELGRNPGTYVNNPALGRAGALKDDWNSAVTFDGAGNWASILSSDSLNSPSGAITIEAWVKPDANRALFDRATTPRVLLRKNNAFAVWLYADLTVEDGADYVEVDLKIENTWRTFGFRTTAGWGWTPGAWNHLVVTYDGARVRLFRQGGPYTYGGIPVTYPQTGNLTLTSSTNPLVIGAWEGAGTGYRFPGTVDEVAVYPSALSAARIKAHYLAGINGCDGYVDIPGAITATYVPTPADVLNKLRVRVTATNASGSAEATSQLTRRVFARYTYAEARALGIQTPPTPAEWGLPACATNGSWPGYATADETAAAATAAPEDPDCAEDPSGTTIVVGLEPPHGGTSGSGYHHNGAYLDASSAAQGGRLAAEVSNPNVDHDIHPDEEFVVARVLAHPTSTTGRWLEIGWAEHSMWDDRRYVYTFEAHYRNWARHTRFELVDGRYYAFRVRDCRPKVCADILWEGKWRPIDRSSEFECMRANGASNCIIEEFLEVFSRNDLSHPDMNAPTDGDGVNFRDTRIRTQPQAWPLWDTSFATSGNRVDPYVVCWHSKWHRFRAGNGITCSPGETQ